MRRALIVEDDPSWRDILQELLEEVGFASALSDDLTGAQEVLRRQSHQLAVVDLSLKGRDHRNQDGLRVLELVRRLNPGCPTILLTGYATVELAVRAMREYGAASCLRKESFSRPEFRTLVLELMAQAPPPPAPSPPLPSPSRPASGAAARALVVEDDAGWRDLLTEMVETEGFLVTASTSFGEGLLALRQERPEVAVVDLSLTAPNDGLRLLQHLRQADIPTLIVSGTGDVEQIEQVVAECGVRAYFQKQSFDRQAFRAALTGARRPPGDPELQTLTEREREVLDLVVAGLTNPDIAERLFISANTVKRHLKSIFQKLGVPNRAAAVARLAYSERRVP